MDPDSPVSRMERTLWTVWGYITGAVTRFFRPEPANVVNTDPDPTRGSAVDSEPRDSSRVDGDAGGTGVDGEQPLRKDSLLGSPRVSMVAWELDEAEPDLGSGGESARCETQPSEGDEDTVEEQIAQRGDGDAAPHVEDERAKRDEDRGGDGDQKLYIGGQVKTQVEDVRKEHLSTKSLGLRGDPMLTEDGQESRREASTEEDDCDKMDDTIAKMQMKEDEKMRPEDEQQSEAEVIEVNRYPMINLSLEEEDKLHEEESRVADKALASEDVENVDLELQLTPENENKSKVGEREVQSHPPECEKLSNDDKCLMEDPCTTSAHAKLQIAQLETEEELTVSGQEPRMPRSNDEAEDVKEKEKSRKEKSILDERYRGDAAIHEEEEEDNEDAKIHKTVEEEGDTEINWTQEEDVLHEPVRCCEEEVEKHTAKQPDGEQEDVAKDPEVQSKTSETDDVDTESHQGKVFYHKKVHESLFDNNQSEGEKLSGDEGSKESYVEIEREATSTVESEVGTGQKETAEFKNIPLGTCEGRAVAWGGRQEGVPAYNNEPRPEENTTQRFLEEGESREIHTEQLPEEVESSEEPESLQNNKSSSETDSLLVREHMEKDRESAVENIEKGLAEAGLSQEAEKPLVDTVIQESGLLFAEEQRMLLVDSVKTGIGKWEKEFESDVGSADETSRTMKELRDCNKEALVEFQTDEVLHGSKKANAFCEVSGLTRAEETDADETSLLLESLQAKGQKMTESLDVTTSEQNSNRTPSLLEDVANFGILEHSDEIEPKLPEDGAVEMHDAGISMEEAGFEVEEEEPEEDRNEILDLRVTSIAAEQTTGMNEMENTLIVKSTFCRAVQIDNQLSNAETAYDSKPKFLSETVTETLTGEEEPVGSVSGGQDVIDEEILDLWIETLSEDTQTQKQEERPEPGSQMNFEREPSDEDREEASSDEMDKDKEQLEESNSGESDSVSDTEMTSSTPESGFLDQSLDLGKENSETRLLDSTSIRLTDSKYDMSYTVIQSADPSETHQHISGSLEEKADTSPSCEKEDESLAETRFHSSEEVRRLNQDSDGSQEEQVEGETGPHKDTVAEGTDEAKTIDWRETEEGDAKSITEMSALCEVEKTRDEGEPLEAHAPDSPDEIQRAEMTRSRSGSETSSEGNEETESSPQDELFPELDEAEVAEQPRTTSEDHLEVEAPELDFTAQKSRIAVKNPLVRPPKDPRSLLNMPSVEPTPAEPAVRPLVKIPAGVPLAGLGMGIKLPGLGAGFPVLRKTQRPVSDENNKQLQEPETKPEEKSETPKQEEVQHKPKWMPRGPPGFGSPLMSELKTKLKKTTEE